MMTYSGCRLYNRLKWLALFCGLALVAGVGRAEVQQADKTFLWYCQSAEATADQKHTVRMLFQLADMDYDVAACDEAYEALSRYSYIALPNSDIKDIAPLSGLDGVDFINLPGNSVAELSGLVDVPRLKKLWLPNNELTEFPDISRFPELNNLVLHGNPISSLAKVSAHPSLRTLRMNGTAIKDYSPLSKLNVSWLELAQSRHPEALSTLPQLPSVIVANLSGNGLTDFARFKAFPKVETIVARGNQISSLKGLESFESIPSNLQLASNKLTQVDSVKVLKGLASIDFSYNPIEDFSFLTQLKDEILSLNLDGTTFADWPLIARFMPKIYKLSLNNTPLATIPAPSSPIEWTNIYRLALEGTKVTSFTAFTAITADKLRRFEGPDLEGATEATCPTAGVPDAIGSYCQGQIGGY